MIYIPDLQDNYICYSFINSDTIRAYKTINLNDNNDYIDIYINSHYLASNGVESLTIQPNCIDSQNLTNDWKYRNDLSDILIITFFGLLFFFGIPLLLLKKLFKRSVL